MVKLKNPAHEILNLIETMNDKEAKQFLIDLAEQAKMKSSKKQTEQIQKTKAAGNGR